MRDEYKLQLAMYDLIFNRRDQLIIEKEKEMSKNLTFKNELRHYNRGTETVVARLDSPIGEDGVSHRVIAESNNEELWCDNNPRMIVKSDSHYLVGPIVDRLHEYESLGYEPEEIKKIIEKYKSLKLVANGVWGEYGQCSLEWPKKNPYLPMIFKVADDEANANRSKIEKLHWIDEIHELPVEGPYHVFLNGIKDVAHLYPKMMIVGGRQNGKSTIDAWNYIKYDTEMTMRMLEKRKEKTMSTIPQIESVRFNKPATIVFWKDGTKTVVKAQPGEPYDPEKGIAMAIAKKALGNKGNYYNTIQKHLEGHEYEHEVVHVDMYIDVSNRNCRLEDSTSKTYNALLDILSNNRATKQEIINAAEEALGYLGEALEEDTE